MRAIWFPDFGPLPEGLPEVRRWILYSFPHEPEARGERRVLSSGTWGIASKKAGRYEAREWPALYEYYRRHAHLNNTGWYMMPDEYLRPDATVANWMRWRRLYPDLPVVPIIQFRREKRVDLALALEQARTYARFNPPCICISNPACTALDWADALRMLAAMIRRLMPRAWIHVLGAGWDVRDVMRYAEIDAIDSIDSIAYYSDAQEGVAWHLHGRAEKERPEGCGCPACSNGAPADWRRLALHNAWVAQTLVDHRNRKRGG